MMMKKIMRISKKSISYNILLSLIIGIITLIIISLIITKSFENWKKNDLLLTCSLSLRNSEFKDSFFKNSYTTPTSSLENIIENNCLVNKIERDNINIIYSTIEDCWIQGGKGFNFLSNYNGNICLVCGEAKVKNLKEKYFNNIDNLDKKKLLNEIEGHNLNKDSLFNKNNFPNSDEVVIYYYIEQKKISDMSEKVKNGIKDITKKFLIFNVLNNLVLPPERNVEYISGIIISDRKDATYINLNNKKIKCDYIYYPKNVYEYK